MHDDEQVEAITYWWKQYGKSIIAGCTLGIACIAGWSFYQNQQTEQMNLSSAQYKKTLSEDRKLIDELTKFQSENAQGVYLDFSTLKLASEYSKIGNFLEAETQLKKIISNNHDETLNMIALERLIPILMEQKKYDDAKTQIAKMNHPSWEGLSEEFLGDLAWSLNDIEQAKSHYQKARALTNNPQLIEMKLNDLN